MFALQLLVHAGQVSGCARGDDGGHFNDGVQSEVHVFQKQVEETRIKTQTQLFVIHHM